MYVLVEKINEKGDLERRVVQTNKYEELGPLIELGFSLVTPEEIDSQNFEDLNELLENSCSSSPESFYEQLVDPYDYLTSFKNTENVIKNIFMPTDVFLLYIEQRKYLSGYTGWDEVTI